MTINQYVEIITDFQALHNWPECPFDEVSYLKNEHRHKIIVTVKVKTIEDRGIEFFMLKDKVDKIIIDLFGARRTKKLGRMSMEEIGTKILHVLYRFYNSNYIMIKVYFIK